VVFSLLLPPAERAPGGARRLVALERGVGVVDFPSGTIRAQAQGPGSEGRAAGVVGPWLEVGAAPLHGGDPLFLPWELAGAEGPSFQVDPEGETVLVQVVGRDRRPLPVRWVGLPGEEVPTPASIPPDRRRLRYALAGSGDGVLFLVDVQDAVVWAGRPEGDRPTFRLLPLPEEVLEEARLVALSARSRIRGRLTPVIRTVHSTREGGVWLDLPSTRVLGLRLDPEGGSTAVLPPDAAVTRGLLDTLPVQDRIYLLYGDRIEARRLSLSGR